MEAGSRLDGGWMEAYSVVVWRSVRGPLEERKRHGIRVSHPKTPVPQEPCYGVVQSRLSSQRLIDTILGRRLWASFLPQCRPPALMHGRARMKKRFGVLLVWTR